MLNNKDIVFVALFAAVTAVLGLMPPIALPFLPGGTFITAQSMGPMLAGGILGFKRGALSQLLFIALVVLGLPILAGGRNMPLLLGPTGGFILSWPIAAAIIGYGVQRIYSIQKEWLFAIYSVLLMIIGSIIVGYLIGGTWLAIWNNTSVWKILIGFAPFIIGDMIKIAIATVIAIIIRRAYPIIS